MDAARSMPEAATALLPPFHLAFPVRDVAEARNFYAGCGIRVNSEMTHLLGMCSMCLAPPTHDVRLEASDSAD